MLEARGTLPYPVTAFTGRQYVAHEWRAVPAGHEAEAEANPYLETRPAGTEVTTASTTGNGIEWTTSASGVGGPVVSISSQSIDATPAATQLAEEQGIDLATVTGTGAGGRVTVNDVREAMANGD